MIDLELGTTFGVEHPELFHEAYADRQNPSLIEAARLALAHTDRLLPNYEENTNPSTNSGNCADRFSRIHTLISVFSDFYPVLATFENQEYGSIHFFNVIVDLSSSESDAIVLDNSFLRDKATREKKRNPRISDHSLGGE